MPSSFTLPALAFVEGLALVLSPCILPVLPLVLGASLQGGYRRPAGIVTGFVLAFTIFALISRQAVLASGIDPALIRDASLVLLALFGAVMLFPSLSEAWAARTAGLGTVASRPGGDGFLGGMGMGALIGIVWTPCAGPILAAAIVQIIQAETGIGAIAIIAAFSLGAGIPMGLIALSGRKLMTRLTFFKTHAGAIRRAFGVLMIAAALSILSGFDLKLAAWQTGADAQEARAGHGLENALATPYPAPELTGLTDWINSAAPLRMEDLRGKVVLVDFWTYSCINCIRTLPYVTRWYDRYKDQGFVVIGVHAPEFAFERDPDNVREAVREHGIHYPVALDNTAATWAAYHNRYWPAHYLIDRSGRVVYTHFGEGAYDVTEHNIQVLLGEAGGTAAAGGDDGASVTTALSPETYLGYFRARGFAGPDAPSRDALHNYTFPPALEADQWALSGPWTVGRKSITAGAGAGLRYRFHAGRVHLVAGSADGQPIDVAILLDGRPAGHIHVARPMLYTLVSAPEGAGTVEIRSARAGLEAYTLTFGPYMK